MQRSRNNSETFDVLELSNEQLIETYRAFVCQLAHKIQRKVKASLPFDDLLAYGFQGLLEARLRYEPNTRVAFTTFAYYRVVGTMLDGIRLEGWVSRRDLKRLQVITATHSVLEESFEIDLQTRRPTSLQEAADRVAELVTEVTMIVQLSDDALQNLSVEPDQESRLLNLQERYRLKSAVNKLNDLQRAVITLHYFEDHCMTDIAAKYGRSKSWASRIHTQALVVLADHFRATEI